MTTFFHPRCGAVLLVTAWMLASTATSQAGVSVSCACDGNYEVGERVRAIVDLPTSSSEITSGDLGTVKGGRFFAETEYILVEWDFLTEGHDGLDECQCPMGCNSTAPKGWYVRCHEIAPEDCGDGVVDVGEACDDGNVIGGDCCSEVCELPTGCKTAGKSVFVLKNSTDGSKDKLIWKWNKGQATTFAQFEEMGSAEQYVACLNTPTSAATLVFGFAWTNDGSKYSYEDATGAPHGVKKAQFKPGDTDKAKISVKGSGTTLPDALSGTLGFPVTVRLVRPGHCFESSFAAAKKNDGTIFKAIAP